MPSNPIGDWASLVTQAQETLDCILLCDVSPVAEKILREHIAEDIYAEYTPAYYQRRHVLERSVEGDLTGSGTLFVTSTANASPSLVPGYSFENRYPGAFLEMLEVGNMGFWRRHFPRPAVTMAHEYIDRSSEIQRTIESGIRREFSAG